MPEREKQKVTSFREPIHRAFADLATYSETDKSAISVRDGVLEYVGAELGIEPAEKVFTVYRSPATISNVYPKMVGIPLTDEHVEIDLPAPDTGSTVREAVMIDLVDDATNTRLAIKNRLSLNDTAVMMLENKRELSLGYHADLVPHETYDFEQVDIVPHHLAAVPAGRCGPLCSFLDRKPEPKPQEGVTMLKAFLDADGAVSLEQIVEIATALPEAIKKVPVDKLQEIMPSLQEIMAHAKEQGAAPAEESEPVEDEEDPHAAALAQKQEDEDMDEEDKPKFSDADFKDALEKEKHEFADAEVKRFAEVVSKARDFVDEAYDFTGKSTRQVMRDALATEYGKQEFSDEELPTAFKLLKKTASYKQFGDTQSQHPLDAIADKELS